MPNMLDKGVIIAKLNRGPGSVGQLPHPPPPQAQVEFIAE